MFAERSGKADAQDVFVEAVRSLRRQASPLRGEAVEDRGCICAARVVLRQRRADLAQKHLVPLHKSAIAIEGDDLRRGIELEHRGIGFGHQESLRLVDGGKYFAK